MVDIKKLKNSVKPIGVGLKAGFLASFNRQVGFEYLMNTLGSTQGLPAKMNQMIATKLGREDAGKVNFAPMGHKAILERIRESSPELHNEIASISENGIPASLGQVHQVNLRDQRSLAIKVQYPEIGEQISSQLETLFTTLDWGVPSKFGFDVDSYKVMMSKLVERELNYLEEAGNQQLFASFAESFHHILIPWIDTDFSSSEILVQEYKPGTEAGLYCQHASAQQRKALGEEIIQFFCWTLFHKQTIHGDMHPQNYAFDLNTNSLILYDFGATLQFSRGQTDTLLHLIRSFQVDQKTNVFDALVHLGFDAKKLSHIAHLLPTLMTKILEPFYTRRPFNLANWDVKAHLDRVLGENKWWFRTAGPTWFFEVLRTLGGVFYLLKSLDINFNIAESFSTATKSLNPQISIPDLREQFPDCHLMTDACARNLQILVKEGGRTIASVTLPARSVEDIENLIPDKITQEINESKIDLQVLKQKVFRSGFLPQDIIDIRGSRSIKVWLD